MKKASSCWCAIQRNKHKIEEMVCSTSKRRTKNVAKRIVKSYAKRGRKVPRYRVVRTASSNC